MYQTTVAAHVPTLLVAHPLHVQEYVICLTAATGERTYGFCRRFLPACLAGVNAPRYPLTLCLLSVHRFFPHFFQARPALWRTL